MLPIPQDYIGSTCEIKSMDNDFLSVGRIIKIDHEAIEIAAAPGEFMQLLKYRLPIKLFVHHSQLQGRTLVGLVYLSTDNFLRIEDVGSLQEFERRGAFRVNSNVEARVFKIMTEGEQRAFKEEVALAPLDEADAMLASVEFHPRVVDLSLTGVRLISPVPMKVGEKYGIELTPVKELIVFCLVVERVIEMPDGSQQYGCSFYDTSERQIDALCRDLFQLQRIEKNRRMNNAANRL